MTILLFLAVYPAALLIAAVNDIYEFKIPNWISLLLVVTFLLAGMAIGAPFSLILEGVMLGFGVLVVGFLLFARNIIGGGDAKLLAATSAWIGFSGLSTFLVSTAMAGAGLAIFLMLFRKTPAFPFYAHAPWLFRLHQTQADIPYAVAICVGGLVSFEQTTFFQLSFGQ